jgi:hypothetical protein
VLYGREDVSRSDKSDRQVVLEEKEVKMRGREVVSRSDSSDRPVGMLKEEKEVKD